MQAAYHPRQVERLAALRAYDILDTPREADFDDIVHLASQICGTPISVVNLIDAHRQWFKAEIGLGVRETPLETSICAHAILEQDFVEISDTRTDRRMGGNALVSGDLSLRFYAGALLVSDDGLPLGTLCVLDYEPRVLTPPQKSALQVLARQVMAQLNLRRALARQDLLGKEVDHRVKNSLASVAAFVALQISRARDPALKASLERVEQRIRGVSLLHEALYLTTALDRIDLGQYLTKLGTMLRANAPESVDIVLDIASVTVDSGRASALGVIISEFVTNSFKHAFPDGRPGRIAIALKRVAPDRLDLHCQDDGVGLGQTTNKPRGLGLRLIDASAAGFGGQVERTASAEGAGLRISFSPWVQDAFSSCPNFDWRWVQQMLLRHVVEHALILVKSSKSRERDSS